ncbi:Re/Si-specific NAD(P)(+) transhydrogenase subunit alpha [Telmatospirillum sp. J64-1]|uniref:Re/Si-specific NAD(P)(+) transhydrogenase subunit alpha n=1 Tax=Telmatospirillum sp. J64-1 TaxID=2502183 RepID=UPI00115C4F7C|nr:Re/Si-specific NAD(P)(+) transhydrogenase subunit alpha [Telmatospirillum sp. J64-1]
MKIAIPKERRPGEARVAASPDTVKKLLGLGFEVVVEKGAGLGSSILDQHYTDAGATIAEDAAATLKDADIVLKVQRPMTAEEGNDELALLKSGAILISHLAALQNREQVKAYAQAGVTAFAMELMPRITRAQSMDILSSQANLAGYRAVIEASNAFGRAFPMMMTAAGTVAPARVLVLGAGVAGLQAIATAKRLGAVVYAFDVRPAVKEQVESLGGKFVEVDETATKNAETAGGYAKEMDEDYKRKQSAKIHETLKKTDIAISTALIPGKPAPVLITEEMVKDMKPGSVIVDLAVEAGGNCPLSELDKVVVKHDVTLIGWANMPSRIAVDSSALYAKNLLNFITPLVDKETKALNINWEDEIIKGTCLTREGKVVHAAFAGEGGA